MMLMEYYKDFPFLCTNCLGSKIYVNIYKVYVYKFQCTELKTCLVTGKKYTSFNVQYGYNYNKQTIICQDFAFIKQICQVRYINLDLSKIS